MKSSREFLQEVIAIGLLFTLISVSPISAQSDRLCEAIDGFVPDILFDADYFEGQVSAYNSAIDENPDDPELYALRGDAYYSLQDFGNAKVNFENAVELDPEYAYAYARLGDTYQRFFDYTTAFEFYTKAISVNLDYAYAYVKRGVLVRKLAYARNGAPTGEYYSQALQDMDIAYELDPTLVLTLARRSELYLEIGNYTQAIRDSQAAVELNLLDPFAHVVSGNVSIFVGDNEDALASFSTALQLESEQVSTYAYAFTARAELCRRLGNFAQAKWDIQQALEIDPTYSWAYFVAARIAEQQQDIATAIENLLLVLEYNPIDPFTYELLDFYGVDEELYRDKLNLYATWINFSLRRNPNAY